MGLYNNEKLIASAEEKIKASEYHEVTKQCILDFENELFLEGLSASRVRTYVSHVHMYGLWLGDLPLLDVTISDVKRFLGQIERSDLSPYTKISYKSCIRRLYRWLDKPELVEWISIKLHHSNSKIPEELLTEDEVKQMIDVANHPRDKAIVAVLYDSGCRISEMGNLRLKHIVFDQYGAFITVDGKTGMRRVRLISSVPYMSAWIAIHPDSDNPNAYLWLGRGSKNMGNQLKYSGYRTLMKKLATDAGIKKRVHNHLFRHSRSTQLAEHLTQAQMEDHLGWVHGSNMPATYIHLSGKQVDDALLKMHGIVKEEDIRPKLTVQQCPRCGKVNGTAAKYCSQCGMAMSLETAIAASDDQYDAAMKYAKLMNMYPELAEYIDRLES
ncbi:tyrosine-type recombinase/integrase [Methanococcoides sp. FTZ1]|uniref:tyrosine-type recombinase/integrase n=1 Tax=Methanococcoides sp. FTZ1 TaxID=3439061 RepID=UPI003F82A352